MSLAFNPNPVLPPPDQSTQGQPGQPIGAPGIPSPTVGGSTSGVDASKGATTAVGVNSLIVDQGVQSPISSSAISGMGMDAASVLGAAPAAIDPQTMISSLGTVATDLDKINVVINSFVSDVSGFAGSASPEGKIKGSDGGPEGSKKGERSDAGKKAEGKGKGKATAEEASPSSGSSVSRATSPTGEVTTTVSTESMNSTGGMTTNTTTTTSTDASSSQNNSSNDSEPSASSDSGISFTQIMDDIGALENQESETLAQQQTSQIDAISQQAADTLEQAANTIQGATMMLDMASVGLAVSVVSSSVGLSSVPLGSKEGDQAEMESMNEQQAALEKSQTMSSDHTNEALRDPSADHISKANHSISETKSLAKQLQSKGIISKEQHESIKRQCDLQSDAVRHAETGNLANAQESRDAAIRQARNNPLISYKQLSVQGIRPGQNISMNDAKIYIRETRTPEAQHRIDVERAEAEARGADDLQEFDDNLDRQDTAAAEIFQRNLRNLKINRYPQAWQNAYSNKFQKYQLYTSSLTGLSNFLSGGLAQMEDETYQAQATRDSAAAQVQNATEQAMSQGVSQTQQVAEQLRQNQSNVAQDMSATVSATKVG